MNRLKRGLRVAVRLLFGIRENENISDGMNRHWIEVKKRIDNRQLTKTEFQEMLRNAGISEGMTVILHASWRNCYMLDATPDEVISCIFDIIGPNGTLLMPCYGENKHEFDVRNTPSTAGVLSECFRQYPNVERSCFPGGAMCGAGLLAHELLGDHLNSIYQFDEHSPYYKAAVLHNARIVLMGMGKCSHKVTVFHCASYDSRQTNEFYNAIYKKQMPATVIDASGVEHSIPFADKSRKNNKAAFRYLLCKTPRKTVAKKGLTLVSFYGRDAYCAARAFCDKGGKLYCAV